MDQQAGAAATAKRIMGPGFVTIRRVVVVSLCALACSAASILWRSFATMREVEERARDLEAQRIRAELQTLELRVQALEGHPVDLHRLADADVGDFDMPIRRFPDKEAHPEDRIR